MLVMHIVIQDPFLVSCASHEGLGLFLCADIESLVVDRLKVPSITASFILSATRARLYKSVFFTLILYPSITTFRGTPLAALYTTFVSSTRQYILGLSPTNSVMRCPLCSSLKMGPSSFLLKLRKDESEGNLLLSTFCL